MKKEGTLHLLKLGNYNGYIEPVLCVIRRDMKTGLVISATLIIIFTASLGIIHNAMAKETPYQAGHDHCCSDAKLTFSTILTQVRKHLLK